MALDSLEWPTIPKSGDQNRVRRSAILYNITTSVFAQSRLFGSAPASNIGTSSAASLRPMVQLKRLEESTAPWRSCLFHL